mmetsp:Transcript_54527/g.144074  ORF Transcript_54527/g.144074 Transcript_54527/m.144074 type:complete len:198 (+) Transcript_54527:112-705(+)
MSTAAVADEAPRQAACGSVRAKVKLSPQLAREIYAIQAARSLQKHAIFQRKISAAAVARQFMVTEKAVRDIWKGRTWQREIGTVCRGELKCTFSQKGDNHTRISNGKSSQLAASIKFEAGSSMKESRLYGSGCPVSRRVCPEIQNSESCPVTANSSGKVQSAFVEPSFDLPISTSEVDPFHCDWPYWNCPSYVNTDE